MRQLLVPGGSRLIAGPGVRTGAGFVVLVPGWMEDVAFPVVFVGG